MSNIQAKDGTDALVPLATHLIGGEHHGAYLPSDPASGAPFKAADDATVAALNVIATAIRTAVEAINAKTTAVNTGAVAGTVAVSNLPVTQAVSAAALPLPSGAATESGNLATLVARTPALGAAAAAASSPVTLSVETASGSITTQNLVPNGAATAGSAVEIVLNGAASVGIQTTGTYTGALSLQVTFDGTRWETVTGAIIVNALTGVAAATIASATVGVFTAPVHGAQRARLTGLAAMTGTANVSLRALAAPTAFYAFQPTAANLNATVAGTVTANVAGAGITGGTISPLTVAGASAEASSAKTSSGNSAAGLTNASGRNAHFIINVSAASGTSPTLVVRVQIQDPVSSTWVDLTGAATGTLTSTGATLLTVTNLPRTYRLAWVIGGTTPSFTFSVGILPVI